MNVNKQCNTFNIALLNRILSNVKLYLEYASCTTYLPKVCSVLQVFLGHLLINLLVKGRLINQKLKPIYWYFKNLYI